MNATKEQLRTLADKFERAGAGDVEIIPEDVEILGASVSGNLHWFDFCRRVYHKLTSGTPCPDSPFKGRGKSSRWYGKTVADAIRAKAESTS